MKIVSIIKNSYNKISKKLYTNSMKNYYKAFAFVGLSMFL
ncbi:hypothetical protein CLV91_1527 [Maribacter vaceletii]|uniref:Uncharacterized protein n=1 Tax=Maribacter vaceletii TaxID=1206816 RepID=A0A495E7B5_9FLAO|nr:hypothetical protein CLV91_1527 [Maribacter vaceletii]